MAQIKRKNTTPNTTRAVRSSSTIRIETPKSHGRQPKPKVSVIVTQPPVVSGFIDFLREHAIVGLAVGFVIGTQVQTVVKQLVASFISPAFSLLFGNNLVSETYTWHFRHNSEAFGWGALVYSLLNFLFVLMAIYLIIKIFKLDKLDKPKI
jgi:large conductance mechanosensitive channel protein